MVLENSLQDFSAGSGLIDMPFLESLYHSVIDETFMDIGRNITLHLPPIVEQDAPTQGQPQSAQYNSYFGRTPAPRTNTRGTGTKITPRDVIYKAQIKVGPMKEGDDTTGMGDLKANQAMITIAIEGLGHVKDAISISIEGRRYTVDETRPIGFSQRRYVMCLLTEINEADTAPGESDG